MERYHELYRLCLAGTAAGMLLSVFLFIRLKICMAVKVLSRKGGKQGGRKSKRVKREKKRREAEVCREEKTVRIAEGIVDFLMIEEILLVHTKEWIGCNGGWKSKRRRRWRKREKRMRFGGY